MDESPKQDAVATADTVLDPLTADPRDLMKALLPPARAEYIKAWEWLADVATPLDRRRAGRARAKKISDDHAIVAAALRDREKTLVGDDLLNARHLADELERHVEALGRIADISPLGLQTTQDLRPEALGCGKRYRDPSKAEATPSGTRPAPNRPPERDARGRGGNQRPGERDDRPRDPKPPRDMLGSSKHDSALGDDMDEATRAKLEELRKALEG